MCIWCVHNFRVPDVYHLLEVSSICLWNFLIAHAKHDAYTGRYMYFVQNHPYTRIKISRTNFINLCATYCRWFVRNSILFKRTYFNDCINRMCYSYEKKFSPLNCGYKNGYVSFPNYGCKNINFSSFQPQI